MIEREVKEHTANQQTKKENYFSPFKLRFPVKLPAKCANNYPLRSALDTWLILKAYYSKEATITLDKKKLEQVCGRCFKSLHTRLNELARLQLCEYAKDKGYIRLAGWDKLAEVLDLGERIKYRYIKYTGDKRMSDILEAAFMEQKETDCYNAAKFKRDKSSAIKSELLAITGGPSLEAIKHSQLHNYLTGYTGLDSNEVYMLRNIVNADTSLSYRKWSEYFGYNSRGGFAYKKRKLQRIGLIVVTKTEVEVKKGTHTTRAARLGPAGRCIYRPGTKSLVYYGCDAIRYLNPSLQCITSLTTSTDGEANLRPAK